VYVGTECKADYGDLRFTLDDGVAFLPYWVEKTSVTSASAKVWVKFPSILSDSSVSYYMLYDNSFANDLSNGAATFDFFDDFNTTLDATKWAAWGSSSPTIASSLLKVYFLYSAAYVGSKLQYGKYHRFRWGGYSQEDQSQHIYWWMGLGSESDNGGEDVQEAKIKSYQYDDGYYWRDWRVYMTVDAPNWYQDRSYTTYTSFHAIEIRYYTGECEFYEDDVFKDSITNYAPDMPLGFLFGGETSIWSFIRGYACYIDWVAVSKVACTEPTFGTWGAEE